MGSSAVWVFLPFEVIIAVACCLGNVLVIWAVWTCGALRQPTFCFIVSLAVADFLVGSVAIPIAVLVDIHMKIPFYGCLFMCCVIIMLEVASVALLLAIAVDRFLRVRIPLTYKSTVSKKRSWIVVTLCWFAAVLLSFIPMFGWHNPLDADSIQCSFLTVISTSYLVNFIFFSFFLPPLALMTCLYCYIFLTTRRQLRANIGLAAESRTYYQKEHRLAASLVLVFCLFAVCWLPVFLMFTVTLYSQNIEVPSVAIDIAVLLSHANSAVNPIVYAFKIPKIKEACMKLWRRVYHDGEQQQKFPALSQVSGALRVALLESGISKVCHLQRGVDWVSAEQLAEIGGFRSVRLALQMLNRLKSDLSFPVWDYLDMSPVDQCQSEEPVFPELVTDLRDPEMQNWQEGQGMLLSLGTLTLGLFSTLTKRILYLACTKALNFHSLRDVRQSKWTEVVQAGSSPKGSWRSLYKRPIEKRLG
ncbi:adenosine receptor A1-like [Colossoma macropomum]|uniref:adenosine receptor A1-like n=1 Tax=Colossoma macropomum TaxID=42526 RepID=UPI001864F5CA|nr:adenosine receptor A1-like [Colossoma macropomum]